MSGSQEARRQERRSLFLATFGAWVAVALGVAGAPIAHAGNDAHLSVGVTVVSTCSIHSQPLADELALPSALTVTCSRNAQRSLVEHGARRAFHSETFSGDVMIATVNF